MTTDWDTDRLDFLEEGGHTLIYRQSYRPPPQKHALQWELLVKGVRYIEDDTNGQGSLRRLIDTAMKASR